MKQYLDLCERVIQEGDWIENKRTGKKCLTIINADLEYDCYNFVLPILTTKKMAWKSAIMEILGYLRGYDNAFKFKEIGCNTWLANANENKAWLANPHRKGDGDMGRCYGVQARDWRNPENKPIDQLKKIYDHLSRGIDDRAEILTFWNPGELDRACLNSCMHTHTFSLVNGELYLTSYQRSCDLALGVPFNMIQTAWLLMLMAQITNNAPAKVFHKLVNVHLYEDQIMPMMEHQLKRRPLEQPVLEINPNIRSLGDVETWVTKDDFSLTNYRSHEAITYPFSV